MQSRWDIAVQAGLTPMVGRQEEISLLRRRWEQSKVGLGQVVLLRGEPGIGKSRLVEALREQVRSEGYRWLTFRCSPYHTHSAFYPVIDALERLLQWSRDMSPEAKFTQLEQALQRYRIPLQEAVPLFAALLSLPLPAERYPPPQPESAAAETAHTGNAGGVPAGGDTQAASAGWCGRICTGPIPRPWSCSVSSLTRPLWRRW